MAAALVWISSLAPSARGIEPEPPAPWHDLQPRLDASWAERPTCRGVTVERLAPSRGLLQILTTDPDLVVNVAEGGRAGLCQVADRFTVFAGHGATEEHTPCVEAACTILSGDERIAAALAEELATSERWPEPPPPRVAPAPAPPPSDPVQGVILLVWCLAALLVPLGLTALGGGLTGRMAWWMWGLAAGAIALRAALALRLGVRPDELLDWGQPDLWGDLAGVEALMNPPLYRVVTAPIAWFVDGDPLLSRLGPVAFGGIATLIAARLGHALSGWRGGLAAGLVVALHPLLASAGAFHRPYALLVPWTLLAAAAVERALAGTRPIDRLLAAAVAGGLPLIHYFGVGPLAGLLVWVLADARSGPRREWLRAATLLLVLVAPLLPLMWWGGMEKGADPTGYAGAEHAWQLIQTAPAAIAGFVMPPLEAPAYAAYGSGLGTDAALAAVLLLALVATAGPAARRSGLSIFALAAAVPLSAAFVLTGIRDFQLVAVAASVSLLAAGAAGHRWGRAAVVVLVVVAALCLVRDWPDAEESRFAPAITWVEQQEAAWPVHVWPYPVVHEIAYHAGGSRAAVDGAAADGAAADGAAAADADEPVLPLSRCSATGVRAALAGGTHVRLLIMDDSCTEPLIEDGDVMCEPIRAPDGALALDCALALDGAPTSPEDG